VEGDFIRREHGLTQCGVLQTKMFTSKDIKVNPKRRKYESEK
jgi:hypothetical protein